MSEAHAAPAPLTPANCCMDGYGYMPLEIDRLRKSRAWLVAKREPHLAFYMVNLWTAAWKETPAASLENDDDVLADAAMCDPGKWPELRERVMRGFRLCTDGRLYHELIACRALEAWLEKLGARISSGAGNAKKHQTAFDDSALREQILVAARMLFTLDSDSRYFTKRPAVLTAILGEQKPKRPAAKPRKSPPKAGSESGSGGAPDGTPGGSSNGSGGEPPGVARYPNTHQSNDVGGIPPTTPRADAPVVGAPVGMPPAPKPPAVPAPSPSPSPTPSPSAAIELADPKLAVPAWLKPHEADWKAFEELRWAKHRAKKPLYTAEAQRRLLLKLEAMHNDGQDLHLVLDASITAGWTDVYPQRGGSGGGSGGSSRHAAGAAAVFGSSLGGRGNA